MPGLLLPFAKRNSDGKHVAPDEVPRGLACDCCCPGCGCPVQAKQGTEKVWHFAHAKASDCQNGYELAVHELAKQLIRDRKRLLIPALDAKAEARDAFGLLLTEQVRVFDRGVVLLDNCELSKRREIPGASVTVDITGHAKGREVLVEITVFHRLMPEKRERLLQTGVACLQIDLSEFKTVQATHERVEAALFADATNRRWLCHPFALAAEDELKARLAARVQESIERKRQQDLRQAEQNARQAEQREAKQAARSQIIEALQASLIADACAAHPVAVENPVMYRMQWRASLPDRERIDAAVERLILRTGCSAAVVKEMLGGIHRRGQLSGTTPECLASQWAGLFGVPDQEVIDFLGDAGYLMPC